MVKIDIVNLLILIIVLPWIVFMCIYSYVEFKEGKIKKVELIIKAIMPLGIIIGSIILDVYFPEKYSDYLMYFFLVLIILFIIFNKPIDEESD